MLFSLFVFVNAFLLFWIEPLFSKSLLPVFGGSPSVWTTAVFFFQLLVLLGYLYAHLVDRHLPVTGQWLAQLFLLAASLLLAPRAVAADAGAGDFHLGSIARQLLIMLSHLGLPFFTVCTFSTLVQRWYSRIPRASGRDPYSLYTASNLGSMAALLCFPWLFEPYLSSAGQLSVWRLGLLGLVLLLLVMGRSLLSRGATCVSSGAATVSPGWRLLGAWTLWAFIPSGMMLAVTTLISVDLVSFPLLWIVPLLLYLLSFVLAFSPRIAWRLPALQKAFVFSAVFALFVWLTEIERPLWLIVAIHLALLFLCSCFFHKRLQLSRPQAGNLTLFYLCLSLGGVLAGAFNSILAPVLFSTIFEYPLLLALALLGLAGSFRDYVELFRHGRTRWLTLAIAAIAFALTALSHQVRLEPFALWMILIFALPLLLSLFLERTPAAMALGMIAVMLSSAWLVPLWGQVQLRRRNFFGTLSIVTEPERKLTKLFHGTTQHGIERFGAGADGQPLAYYHPSGPCGLIFRALYRDDGPKDVALIGLGIGSQLAYARSQDRWTVFEIDPDVIDVATDGRWFSYWRRCPAEKRLVEGDGRIRLGEQTDGSYDLLVVDAFNSDTIPMHLLTREAFELYLKKLKPDGLLALHITNRNVDLSGPLQHLASALDLTAYFLLDSDDSVEGKFMSHWMLLSRLDPAPRLKIGSGKLQVWRIPAVASPRPWRDDWNNLVGVIRWKQ